ncbi:MAG: hypothetical protein H6667_07140 [Ardenticatenaceae bacterium]|nr:hypothetical protein [Ardenticatenaceae bacterium]MCB9444150.1 hypothetical protein [Ardenticatenaceae bacterium]
MQKNIALSISIMATLTFVSCQREVRQTTATLPPTVTANTTLSQSPLDLLTASPMLTNTVEIKETTIPSSTLIDPTVLPTIVPMTIIPSSTPVSPTIVPVTLTPLPTLEGEALESSVAELLANPMNCTVPCWWGAIPNETTFFEILQFIELYQLDDYIRYLEQIPDDSFELGIRPGENTGQYGFRVMYGFNNNNVLTFLSSGYAPPISNVLKKYGQPYEVWLATGIERPPMPFRLNLVYLPESMAFGYVAGGNIQNDRIQGCFTDETGSVFLKPLNSVTKHTGFYTLFEEDRLYLPLEKASNLSIDEFMETFSDPTQPHCIETPTELWK